MNQFLYIIGFISLWGCIGLLSISFYTFPYLIWGYQYNVLDFIYTIQDWLIEEKQYTTQHAAWIIIGSMWFLAYLLGMISRRMSYYLDASVLDIQQEAAFKTSRFKNTIFKIVGIIVIVLLFISIL